MMETIIEVITDIMKTLLIGAGIFFFGTILFCLCKKGYEKLDGIGNGKKREAHTEPAAAGNAAPENFGTPLTMELVRKAVIFNGFVPVSAGDNWFSFKIQGENYAVGYFGNLEIVFTKIFGLDKNDVDYECMKDAVSIVFEKTSNGRISINEENDDAEINFAVFGIEKTYEHLCISFMDYVNMLINLIDAHRYEYGKIIQEREQASNLAIPGELEGKVVKKILS